MPIGRIALTVRLGCQSLRDERHDDNESDATVFLGEADWEPRRVSEAGGLPNVGDLVLNAEEQAFLGACGIATAWRRDAAHSAERYRRRDLPRTPAGN